MISSRGLRAGVWVASASQSCTRRSFSSHLSTRHVRPSPTKLAQTSIRGGLFSVQSRSISWNPLSYISPPPDATSTFAASHGSTEAAAAKLSIPEDVNTPASTAASLPDSSAVTDAPLDALSRVDIPSHESIGYLHSLGLDYGWGPTSLIEWTLEHIHVYSGLPWWLSIFATATVLRLATFPLTIRMSDTAARLQSVKPEMNRIQEKVLAARDTRDMLAIQKAQAEMKTLSARAGIKYSTMIANPLVMLVFAFCGMKLMRQMADLPVPGLLDGGVLWFSDLTIADPYYLIPLAFGAVIHANFRLGSSELGGNMQLDKVPTRMLLLYIIPVICTVSMVWLSTAVTLWLAAGGLVQMVGARLLLSPSIRDRLGILQMPAKELTASSTMAGAGKTIDVSASSSSASSTARASSTSSSSRFSSAHGSGVHYEPPSSSRRASTSSTTSKKGTMDRFVSRANAAVDRDQALARQAGKGEKQGLLARYTAWGAKKVNDLGEGYASAAKAGSELVTTAKREMKGRRKTKEDTPDSRFREEAAEYERRARELKQRRR